MPRVRVRTKKRVRKSQHGAAAVEMAIVLPLLFLLVFGIIEFGFVFNRWITVTHAAREGVRVYSLGSSAADSEAAAEAAAPDLGSKVDCTASEPAIGQVKMNCATVYDLALFVFQEPVTLSSNAVMRRE